MVDEAEDKERWKSENKRDEREFFQGGEKGNWFLSGSKNCKKDSEMTKGQFFDFLRRFSTNFSTFFIFISKVMYVVRQSCLEMYHYQSWKRKDKEWFIKK